MNAACGTGTERALVDGLRLGRAFRLPAASCFDGRRCLHARGSGDRGGSGHKGEQVVAVRPLALERGAPRVIRVDNGPEFVSKALDRWAHENAVTLDSSRPGTPTDNAFAESFNGRLRVDCSTRIGSCGWPTPGARSRRGGGSTTRAVLTPPWDGEHPRSLPWPRPKRLPRLTLRTDQNTGTVSPTLN